jgi:hypothetical protein
MPERVNRSPTRSQAKNQPGVDAETDSARKPGGFYPAQSIFAASVVIPIEKKCTSTALKFFANFLSNCKLAVIASAK